MYFTFNMRRVSFETKRVFYEFTTTFIQDIHVFFPICIYRHFREWVERKGMSVC